MVSGFGFRVSGFRSDRRSRAAAAQIQRREHKIQRREHKIQRREHKIQRREHKIQPRKTAKDAAPRAQAFKLTAGTWRVAWLFANQVAPHPEQLYCGAVQAVSSTLAP
jgi:uncharacterized protein (DUF3084 family)